MCIAPSVGDDARKGETISDAPPREARTGTSRSTVDSMARRLLLNLRPVRRKSAAKCRSRYGASRRGRAGSRRG